MFIHRPPILLFCILGGEGFDEALRNFGRLMTKAAEHTCERTAPAMP